MLLGIIIFYFKCPYALLTMLKQMEIETVISTMHLFQVWEHWWNLVQ